MSFLVNRWWTEESIARKLPPPVVLLMISEMYRGLGSVVVGGLIVSTVFTLVLVPLLFSLVLEMRRGFSLVWTGREQREASTEDFAAAPAGA